MKLVVNKCYGGFSISLEAAQYMAAAGSEHAQKEIAEYEASLRDPNPKFTPRFYGYGYLEEMDGGYNRADPLLVAAVETLGEKASGSCAKLEIVEIPDGVNWEIEEYDGQEWVSEAHRTW